MTTKIENVIKWLLDDHSSIESAKDLRFLNIITLGDCDEYFDEETGEYHCECENYPVSMESVWEMIKNGDEVDIEFGDLEDPMGGDGSLPEASGMYIYVNGQQWFVECEGSESDIESFIDNDNYWDDEEDE